MSLFPVTTKLKSFPGGSALKVLITGSIAYDYIMTFSGYFKEHILPDQLEHISLSFLVDSMCRQRGGCATNIAYNLALLGERPTVMGTVGQDFGEYRDFLERCGVDTSLIVEIKDDFTASFFVSTDKAGNQIASFYTGAMRKARELSFKTLNPGEIRLAIISPNDPEAMKKYARECQELGIPYIYDPSQQIVRLKGKELIEGARGAHILILNDYEYGLFKSRTGLTGAQVEELVPTLIITCGENGSYIIEGGRRIDIPAVKPKRFVDPTGVGDAYRAGIIKGIIHNLPWEVAGRIASLAATYSLEETGPQSHHYTLEEFVRRYEDNFGPEPLVRKALLEGGEASAQLWSLPEANRQQPEARSEKRHLYTGRPRGDKQPLEAQGA